MVIVYVDMAEVSRREFIMVVWHKTKKGDELDMLHYWGSSGRCLVLRPGVELM